MLIYYACGRERGLKGVTDLLENSGEEGTVVGEKDNGKGNTVEDELEKVDGGGEVRAGVSETGVGSESGRKEGETAPVGGLGRGRERANGRGHSHAKKEP